MPSTTTTTTSSAIPVVPASFNVSGNQDEMFYFNVPSLDGNVLVSVRIPKSAVTAPVQMKVLPVSSRAEVSAGIIDLDISMNQISNGTNLTDLGEFIEVRYWTSYIGAVPAIVENGSTLSLERVFSSITNPSLNPGFYVYPDNTYSIFTKKLSIFKLLFNQQSVLLSGNSRQIFVGRGIQLRVSGGSGTGAFSYSTKTPKICQVSSIGFVTGLTPGGCLVTVAKAGSGKYLSALSNTVLLAVREATLQAAAGRNRLIYFRQGDGYGVNVDLSSTYAFKQVELQLRQYVKGRLTYKTLSMLKLDQRGDATFLGEKALLKGSRLRLIMEGSNLKWGLSY